MPTRYPQSVPPFDTLREPRGTPRRVPEALVHDLWQQQRFDRAGLATTDGQRVTVFHPGTPNPHGGPDFRVAHLRIGDLEWRGDVEIHLTSADWAAHGHPTDARYNATVLHVTLEADTATGALRREDGTLLPECVLRPLLTEPLRALLRSFLLRSESAIPCADQWAAVPEALRRSWIQHLARERMARKTQTLADRYLTRPALETLLYQQLFRGLGYTPNADTMADLARRVPLALARTLQSSAGLEALYLGTAGLLPETDEHPDGHPGAAYVERLRQRFAHLRDRHTLTPMERPRWQFFRLRPNNFPTLRIAQGAALLRSGGLLRRDPIGRLLDAVAAPNPVKALRTLLEVRASAFWNNHVRLERPSKPHAPALGRARIDTLIVNAVLPVASLIAEQEDDAALEEAADRVLRQLPAGRDRILRRFADLGTRPADALEAQGLHQLYRTRCSKAACLHCAIGRALLEEA